MTRLSLVAAALVFAIASGAAVADEGVYRGHGLAMHGGLKYPADFKHFDYVNPNAPKGGSVTLSGIGGFDSFNGFIIKGNPAQGLGRIYDSLMVGSADEPLSMYCLVCETIEVPKDRSWVVFNLNPKARWHDGKPITVEDVIWSFNTLFEKGRPFFRFYYGSVAKVEKTGPASVKFTFKPGENRELPLILGQLPVLPKHYWENRDFSATTLEPPLGSGAYRIKDFETNRTVVYERVEDYWAKDHPTQVGRDNFDIIREDYYRDRVVAREAFKAGAFDFWRENSAKEWATAFNIPALRNGALVKKATPNENTQGMQGFVFNLRKRLFQDPRVRRALNYAFDFEWSNKTLFYGQYTRTDSYFDNSELASSGLPEGKELAILEKFRDKLPKEVFDTVYTNPKTDGSGNIRSNLRMANKLLHEAGWRVDKETRKLTHTETGQVFAFEVILVLPGFERIVLPYKQNLARLGIDVSVRTVDSAQYQKRVQEFDFDVIIGSWGQSESPGNEQRDFWGSDAADRPGSLNLTGLKDPVVDELVEILIAAPDRESLVAATRALDRVLLWKFLVVPNYHIAKDRIAYWNKFGQPSVVPKQGVQFSAWWIDRNADGKLERDKAPADGK